MEPPRLTSPTDDHAPEPDADHLRARLVDTLRAQGTIRDPEIERALRVVPRHLFLPGTPLRQAYADIAVPTHWERGVAISSASQPTMVAIMLAQLVLQPGMRVLEIGAGTGYNAALLATIVGVEGAVTTVDIDPTIAEEARSRLWAAGVTQVHVETGDGARGFPAGAPYDRIILTAGAMDISPAWVEQLDKDGLLVAPLRLGGAEASVAFIRDGNLLRSVSLSPCGFMRLRGAEAGADHTAALQDDWRLSGERAQEVAPVVSRLLTLRPRRRIWSRPSPLFPLYLGLGNPGMVYLWRERAGVCGRRTRGRFGLYAEGSDGPSLALWSATLPALLVFGGREAERALEADVARWRATNFPPMEAWRVLAYPHGSEPATPPLLGVRIPRRHYVFDVLLDQE